MKKTKHEMRKIEIIYHLKEGRQITQIANTTKEKFEEILTDSYLYHAQFITIPEEGLYIPFSSILFIEVKEI